MDLVEKILVSVESPLIAFDGTKVYRGGIARLMVHVVERTLLINFLVMEADKLLMRSWAKDGFMPCTEWSRLCTKL